MNTLANVAPSPETSPPAGPGGGGHAEPLTSTVVHWTLAPWFVGLLVVLALVGLSVGLGLAFRGRGGQSGPRKTQ